MLEFRWQYTIFILTYQYFTSIHGNNFTLTLTNLNDGVQNGTGSNTGYETVIENINETKSTDGNFDSLVEIHLLPTNETQRMDILEKSQTNTKINYIISNSTNTTDSGVFNKTSSIANNTIIDMSNAKIPSSNEIISLTNSNQTDLSLETQMNSSEINLINHIPTEKEIYTTIGLVNNINSSIEISTLSSKWEIELSNYTTTETDSATISDEYTTTEIINSTIADDAESTESNLYNISAIMHNVTTNDENIEEHNANSTLNIWNIIMPVVFNNSTDQELNETTPLIDEKTFPKNESESQTNISESNQEVAPLSTPDKILQELIDNFFTPVISESSTSTTTEMPIKKEDEAGEDEEDGLLSRFGGGGYNRKGGGGTREKGLLETREGWLTSAQLSNDFLIAYTDG